MSYVLIFCAGANFSFVVCNIIRRSPWWMHVVNIVGFLLPLVAVYLIWKAR